MLSRNNRYEVSSIESGKIKHIYSLKKCRVCMDAGEIPIFGVKDISEDVMEFGKIEIGKDDNLPQFLCEACNRLLESAILFRKTAKETNDVLGKPVNDSDSEDSDYIHESEPDIEREYLELNYSSDSEFDKSDIKRECGSVVKSTNYDDTISGAVAEESNVNKDFQVNLLKIKDEPSESNNEADSEMIMIIVSDKDKKKRIQLGCEKCNITFETSEKLTQHVEITHPKPLPYEIECEICHNIVLMSTYSDHLKEHRQKYKEKCQKRYRKVDCDICGKKVSKSYIREHMKMHGTAEEQAERVVECRFCKKTVSAGYYSDHVKRVHDKNYNENKNNENMELEPQIPTIIYKCPVCDKEFKESEYKLHLASHGGPQKSYICDKCGKVFKHLGSFKTHRLTHGSELKYKCQFCPYRGLHQGLLKIHVRTHTGDYNYKCTECPARFITKSNLSRHLKRHKGLCNFECEICKKRCYTKRDMDKHTKNVHAPDKNHICELCGKGFGHRDNMLSHQLKVHKRDRLKLGRGRTPSYLLAEQKHSGD